jgi:hypothetical protein
LDSPIALIPILVLLLLLGVDRWVYVDAKIHARRGSPVSFSVGDFRVDTPAAWAVGCLLASRSDR